MDIYEFQKRLFEKGKQYGFSEMEVFYSSNKSTTVSVQNTVVVDYKIAEVLGLSFRGMYMDKLGYSYSENISEESIDYILKEALENAQVIEVQDEEELFESIEQYGSVNAYSESLANLSVETMIESALQMEKTAHQADARVKQVLECNVSKAVYEVSIMNTKGLNCHSKSSSASAVVYVMASEDEQAATGFYFDFTLTDFARLDVNHIAKTAVAEAVSKLGAVSLPSGSYPIIFRYDTATTLLGSLVSNLSGENVEKGLSKLQHKLNEKIAGSNIDLFEDPLMVGAPGATTFDAEGFPTRKTILIKSGTLLSFLHNRKTAKKVGAQSTGNASKHSYRSTIAVGPHNVYLKPGRRSVDELVQSTEEGIFIIELQGTHAGINSVSGDFSLYAGGFLIENGKLTKPVNQITVSGNIFDLMNHVDELANDLIIRGNITAPSIKVNRLAISGQ
ncbi:peptidase [Paenibacillus silvae]|uniref:Peptidase n=1 Tax=Paenibacillus silvae TaxID=1325358 RepID=A0ABQ1Z709_9BACL|nr:TldD/PmbA family protein [Paenibacillus silvae]GGH50308.1 peptidase [Paenibacillus silvae]